MGAGSGQILPSCPAASGVRHSFGTVSYSQGSPKHSFSPQIAFYVPGCMEPPQSRAQLSCSAEQGSPCSNRGVGFCPVPAVMQLLWGVGRGAPCSKRCTPRGWHQRHLTGGCPSPCPSTVLTRDICPLGGSCSIEHRQDSSLESSSDTHHCF